MSSWRAFAISNKCASRNSGTSTAEIDVPTFDTPGIDSHEFVYSEFEADGQLLTSHTTGDREPTYSPINLTTLVQEQFIDPFCQQIRERLNAEQDLLLQRSEDGHQQFTVQTNTDIVIPKSLQRRVTHNRHNTQITGHPGDRKMFHYLLQHFCWPPMGVGAYNVEENCTFCSFERIKLRKRVTDLKLFPTTNPLAYVSINILGSLLDSNKDNTTLFVITDRFSKLTKTVPLRTTSAHNIVEAFTKHWIFPHGLQNKLPSDNRKRFTSRFFTDTSHILVVSKLYTTTYYPQTNGQTERFNRILFNALHHYVANQSRTWD